MLDEKELKTRTKKVIDRGERSKTLSEVKPVENINKNQANASNICKAKL